MTQKLHLMLISVLLLSQLVAINCLFEKDAYVDVFSNSTGISLAAIESDFVTSFYFYADTEKCKYVSEIYSKFAEDANEDIKAFAVDCDEALKNLTDAENLPACSPEKRDLLPTISFFKPFDEYVNSYEGKRQMPKEYHYKGEPTAESIKDFARTLMPQFAEVANNKFDLEDILADKNFEHRVLIFNKNDILPHQLKAITSRFRDLIQFIIVPRAAQDIVNQYKIEKFPSVVILRKVKNSESFEPENFDGQLQYGKLFKFIKPFLLREKAFITYPRSEYERFKPVLPRKLLDEIKKSEKGVILHLYKEEKYKTVKKLLNKTGDLFNYLELNCSTSPAFKLVTENFKIKNLPAIVYIPPGGKKLERKTVIPRGRKLSEMIEDLGLAIDITSKIIPANGVSSLLNKLLVDKIPIVFYLYQKEEDLIPFEAALQLPKYAGKIRGYRVVDPNEEVQKVFGATKVPFLTTSFLPEEIKGTPNLEDIKMASFRGQVNTEEIFTYFDEVLKAGDLWKNYGPNKKQTNDEL